MDYLRSQIETLIFCANSPIKAKDIQLALAEMLGTKVNLRDVKKDIAALVEKYQSEEFTFEICNLANGYQFLTKPNYHKIIEMYLGQKSRRGLSQSALETLAIIAYKQPITKSQIENIRGMGSDYTVRKLLEKELITIRGKAPTPGRPILYGTSSKFMHYFGINSIEDLPFPADLEAEQDNMDEEDDMELRAIEAIDVSFQSQENKKDISELLEEAGEELEKEEAVKIAEDLLRKENEQEDEAESEDEIEHESAVDIELGEEEIDSEDKEIEDEENFERESLVTIESEGGDEETEDDIIPNDDLENDITEEFFEEVKSEIEIPQFGNFDNEETKTESEIAFFETIDEEDSFEEEDNTESDNLDDID